MMARPRVLTIAGSDSGGGAGIQADLKTFAALGAYGASVITAVTAQNTRAVTAVHEIPAEIVARQLEAVLDDIGADAIKIGMLANVEIIEAVAEGLAARTAVPVVLDPVMVSKSGDALLREEAVAALSALLVPRATLITPNLPEAERLTGMPVDGEAERERAAAALAERGPAVLLKGGHGEGPRLVDLLYERGSIRRFEHPRLDTRSTHGTGCTLSSAVAVGLAAGRPLGESVERAIDYLHGAIAAAAPIGSGHGPVDHLYLAAPMAGEGE